LCVCGCVTTCYMFACVWFHPGWLAGCDFHNLISCSVPKRKTERKREGNSIFNTHFFLVSAREKERKETPYSIRIFLFSAREKERKEAPYSIRLFLFSTREKERKETPSSIRHFGKLFRIEEPFQISLSQALDCVCVCVCVFSTSCSSCQNVKMCTLL
jgi:hypothetical protein